MAADIQTIRTLIGDNRKVAVNEVVGVGDSVNRYFQLDMFPMVSGATASLVLFLTGVEAVTANLNISGNIGRLVFTAGNAPTSVTILANYEYFALTSGELTDFLSGHTGAPFLAAANACLALAGDARKLFSYTMGEKAVDKRKIASDLRELSKELIDRHYRVRDDSNFSSKVFTFKDNTGTPYESYDSAVTFLPTGIC